MDATSGDGMWRSLRAAVAPEADPHAVAMSTVAEYAFLRAARGERAAAAALPTVAAHLESGCQDCGAQLAEMTAVAQWTDRVEQTLRRYGRGGRLLQRTDPAGYRHRRAAGADLADAAFLDGEYRRRLAAEEPDAALDLE